MSESDAIVAEISHEIFPPPIGFAYSAHPSRREISEISSVLATDPAESARRIGRVFERCGRFPPNLKYYMPRLQEIRHKMLSFPTSTIAEYLGNEFDFIEDTACLDEILMSSLGAPENSVSTAISITKQYLAVPVECELAASMPVLTILLCLKKRCIFFLSLLDKLQLQPAIMVQ